MYLSNSFYDILAKIQRFLPAIGAAYLALAKVWGLDFGSEINETIAIVATLIACFLEVCSSNYHKQQAKMNEPEIEER